MFRKLLIFALMLAAIPALAQITGVRTVIIKFASTPTGPCSFFMLGYKNSNAHLYTCTPPSTWTDIGSTGAAPTFDLIGAGSNANALVIATGGSLTVSGSGTINATSLAGSAAALYALLASPTLATPHITQILDGNGNVFLLSSATASAVDSLTITNAATANPATVTIGATGTDTNIHLAFLPKGTGANIFNNGSAANPSIAFVGGTTSGFHFVASNTVVVYDQAGVATICFGCSTNSGGTNQGGLNSASSALTGWSSTTDPTAASDLMFGRGGAAANMALGGNTSASPVNQTFRSVNARGGTDTDHIGSQFNILAGLGTGAAIPQLLVFKGDVFGSATGSTLHTSIQRHIIEGSATLTSGAAKDIISLPLATLKTSGGTIWYTISGYNATDQCVTGGSISYVAENKAGAFVTNVSTISNASTACSTGTLTVSWAVTSANPAKVQATATLSLSSPTAFRMVYEASNTCDTCLDPTYTNDGT